jgi:hypothetical protein
MKISKLFQLGSALVLMLSTLLSISIPLAHALQVCTWTGADSGNSLGLDDASNYNGCGTIDGTSILIFPASASSLNPQLVTNLTVNSIAFQGDNYHITSSSGSNVLTVSSDISTSPSSVLGNEIDVNITLTNNNPTIDGNAHSPLTIGSGSDMLHSGTNNLTLANVALNDPVVGSGSLIINDTNYPTTSNGVKLMVSNPGYTGSVVVSQGALFVGNASALTNASSVTVSGGLLKGTGGVSSAVIQTGGKISPGNSPGCLTATSLTLGGTYDFQVGGTNACTDYDQVSTSSGVNLSGGNLHLSIINGFAPTVGQNFKLINNTSNNAVIGTFNGLSEGATFIVAGNTFQITYKGGDGNDVVVTVITPVSAAGTTTAARAAAPKSPNTGLAAMVANPWETLALTILSAGSLLVIARRLKPLRD